MVLSVTVPQAWMTYQAKNWTPPEFWDDGIMPASTILTGATTPRMLALTARLGLTSAHGVCVQIINTIKTSVRVSRPAATAAWHGPICTVLFLRCHQR